MHPLNIAQTLIDKRKEKGVTQEALAHFIGVTKASVSKWENGQSYPDITLLPLLANYFNLTIDELINYNPQLDKETIDKHYLRLAKAFSEQPFEEVVREVETLIKHYYACYPFLFQMGVLLLNHYTLTEEAERVVYLQHIIRIYEKIIKESKDFDLCKQASMMEVTCYMILGEPDAMIERLKDCRQPIMNERSILATAYAMKQEVEQVREILQMGIYEHMLCLLQNMTGLLQQEMAHKEQALELIARIEQLMTSFQLEKLHPAILFNVYYIFATVYTMHQEKEKALAILQKYTHLASSVSYPFSLHGDAFFDHIEDWIQEQSLGGEMPRDSRLVKQDIIKGILENPMFAVYNDEPVYKQMICTLKAIQ